MLKEIFLGEEKFFTLNLFFFHVVLILISFAFVYVFSSSTSFAYPLFGLDSSVFQAVGKFWTEGHLPYVELFEHKGPLLFLINAIGYAIYPRAGIMVPQIIFLYLSCLLLWRAMEFYSASVAKKNFFLAVMLIFYAAHYEEGNHVEEYSVLFLSAATWCFMRGLKENKFFPLYGFVYGFGFGACFMIRLSDAATICCQVFLTAIFLLQDKDFKTFRENFLSFCAGFAMIVLPFVIYFAAHGALYEMFFGTFLFNLKYTGVTFHFPFKIQVAYDVFHFLPLIAMIIVGACALKQNPKNRLMQSAIFIGAMPMLMLINLRPYLHYAMIIFPVMPILFAVLDEYGEEFQRILCSRKSLFKRLLFKGLIILAAVHIVVSSFYLRAFYLDEKTLTSILFFTAYAKRTVLPYSQDLQNILKLQKIIPENERKSFVTWGHINTISQWILLTDMKPRERFFMHNAHHFAIEPSFRQEWFGNVRKDYPLWILYGTDPDRKPGEPPTTPMEDSELEELLAEKYSLKGEVYIFPQMLKLYRLKE